MKTYDRITFAALLVIGTLGALALPGVCAAQPAPVRPCKVRLQVELTPDVPNPRDAGFVSSLLGNHPDYRLTLRWQDPEDASVIALDLTGPEPMAGCREVINSMRKDARVVSVAVQRDAVGSALPSGIVNAPGMETVRTAQPLGTVRAGPDGDWILRRSSSVSAAEQARVRYQCDIGAVEQTGFDPTEDDGGVPPDEVAGKRADYLRAEAACFEAHGYVLR